MSGIAKAVNKTFKAVTKTVKKVVKSKVFKTAAMAAVVYFGGAALNGIIGGQGAMAGISNAWTQLGTAGTSLVSGNFSQAGSAIGKGFTGSNLSSAAMPSVTNTGFEATKTGLNSTLNSGSSFGANAGLQGGKLVADTTITPGLMGNSSLVNEGLLSQAGKTLAESQAATQPQSGGLLSGAWNALGEAGKAAAITSGVAIGGQMLQGQAAEKQAEEERKRRTYWGVDGEGQGDASGNSMKGLLQLAQTTQMNSFKPSNAPWNAPQPQQFTPQVQQPQTLDELIKRLG